MRKRLQKKLAQTLLLLIVSWNFTFAQGVHIVSDFTPGIASTFQDVESAEDEGVVTIIGNRVFTANSYVSPNKLWVTDASNLSSIKLLETSWILFDSFIELDGDLYFLAYDNVKYKLMVVHPDNSIVKVYESNDELGTLTVFKGNLYFTEDNKLIKYNKIAGISMIYEFYWFAGIMDFTATADKLFIIGDTKDGRKLFTSDGTSTGTIDYYLLSTGSEFNRYIYMTPVGNKVFFWYKAGGDVYRLWVTDGTAAGTLKLKEHKEIQFENMELDRSICPYNGKLYYRANSTSNGDALYVSDGTVAGTKLYYGTSNMKPKFMFVYNNKLYFQGLNSFWNPVWLRTGGTQSDVEDLFSGYGAYSTAMTVYNSDLIFIGWKEKYDNSDIYKYNIQNGAITELTNISKDDYSYEQLNMKVVGNKVFFTGLSPDYGRELFVFDPALNGNFPTQIRSQSMTQVSCTEQATNLYVEAYGAELSYQWQKNSVDISGANSPLLNIPSTSQSDAGDYKCLVNGKNGNAVSSVINITVQNAISASSLPAQMIKNKGETIQIQLTATGNNNIYQWYKNSVSLKDTLKISGTKTSVLKIENAEKSDTGYYYCHITGICNELNSDTLELKIVLPTKIVSQPTPLKICVGETASFVIQADGENLKYQWKKDGVIIAGATLNNYKITNAKASDSGSYACFVSGAGGDQLSNAALLTVNVKPEISVQPLSQNVAKGADAKISVTAIGTIESFQWYKDGVKLTNGTKYSGATSSELKIINVSETDKGSYHCVITGPCGSVTSVDVTLNVTSAVQDDMTEKIIVFPNPATNVINIETADFAVSELELKDNLGRVAKSMKNSDQMNISDIQQGLYFLTVRTKETKIVKKILIAR